MTRAMQYSSDGINPCSGYGDDLKISSDGYVRMSLAVFMNLPLVHFLTGLDDEPVRQTTEGGKKASISGYSEWLSKSFPTLSVGWDWRLDLATGVPRYLRVGAPRSNIMLIDASNDQDIEDEVTAAIIALRIDQDGWSDDVSNHISSRYSLRNKMSSVECNHR